MKIKNLYNLQSVQAFQDSVDSHFSGRKASFRDNMGGGIVMPEALTHIDPQIFRKQYPALALMMSGIAVDNSGGYSSVIKSLRIAEEGSFKYSTDRSTDKGVITLAGEESLIKVHEREAQASWTDSQVQEAALQGINLPAEYMTSVLKTYQYDIDRIGLVGTSSQTGLMNNTIYTNSTASDTIGEPFRLSIV